MHMLGWFSYYMWIAWHDSYDFWTLGGYACLSLQDLSHGMDARPHVWGTI
jgi:hypothetical protein